MNNLSSYCGLVDAKRASDEDLPVLSALVVRPDGHNKAEHPELHLEQLLFYCNFKIFISTEKKKNLITKQMKQTFLAPIEAPCWLRPAKTASGVLGCIASIILTNRLFSQKIRDKNSVKPL